VSSEDNQVRVLASNANSVVMEFVMPSFGENDLPFFVESVELGGQSFQRLILKGLIISSKRANLNYLSKEFYCKFQRMLK